MTPYGIEAIGWLSGILFACCGLPQAVLSYKSGNSRGISAGMLWMWFWGEILAIIYVLSKIGFDKPLLFNYTINVLFILVILKYKYFERSNDE